MPGPTKLVITDNDLPAASPRGSKQVVPSDRAAAHRPLPTIQGVKPAALQLGGLAKPHAAPANPQLQPAGWYANPAGPGQRYWDGGAWADGFIQPPAPQFGGVQADADASASSLVAVGYILAVLMPLIGFILGIVVVTRPEKATSKHGVWVIVASVVAFIVWLAIFSAQSSSGTA